MLLSLHSAFMISVVNLLLEGEVGVCALNDHGKSWKNHGIVFLNFCGNPGHDTISLEWFIVRIKVSQVNLANSAYPDEMPQIGAFHQDLHCLQKYLFRGFQYTKG